MDRPGDIAAVATFLASADAGWISGERLVASSSLWSPAAVGTSRADVPTGAPKETTTGLTRFHFVLVPPLPT